MSQGPGPTRNREGIPLVRILLLGDLACGKSCFMQSYVEGWCSQQHVSTIGYASKSKVVDFNGVNVKIQLM